ncbi:unnamed protein product, partial [Tetraodon nigroviridis]
SNRDGGRPAHLHGGPARSGGGASVRPAGAQQARVSRAAPQHRLPQRVLPERVRSTPGWTLVAAAWAREASGPGGGERLPAALHQDAPRPDSCGEEPQGGRRAGDGADRQGEPGSGAEAGPAGRLPGQTEGAGGRGGAAAPPVARRSQVGLDPAPSA